ncbi:Flap-structured DNA-binding and RNA-binding protein [Microbotryomycetes sp. JL201]|nr:Flap-structured DNA-binding and RNA-binding protein [Microbotryomycetes sp. JL201]
MSDAYKTTSSDATGARASLDPSQLGQQQQPPMLSRTSPVLNNGDSSSRSNSPRAPGRFGARPTSDLLQQARPSSQQHNKRTTETEAIDRWFEDLQQYEQTLEDMAAASLDANFKEELTAIEQWFRVLSEAERTAALYSLLQSSTQVQVRFFITVLQQMARSDPTQNALMSPANPSQLSLEAQMEAKLASLGLRSPASPIVRQFARQSLGQSETYLSPHTATLDNSRASPPSPVTSTMDDGPAASTLANQRAKLKASSRTSAPANLHPANALLVDKSPLWSERETLVERRSPSPGARPRSTEPEADKSLRTSSNQHLSRSTGPSSTASFLRSPGLDFDQMSPMPGGSWASMVNTPLVPMFAGKNGAEPGSTMPQGDYGDSLRSPGLEQTNSRLNTWSPSSPGVGSSGIVLDDARKFRRSARIGAGAFGGGALGGMYEEERRQQQDSLRRAQLSTMQQNAINLGLGSLPSTSSQRHPNGSLNSPGLQQTAMAAQQNWRNGLNSPSGLGSMSSERDQFAAAAAAANTGALNVSALNANAQLASLVALQQQVLQQQQQLNNSMAAAGLNLSPVQLFGLQQQQQLLSPGRLGAGLNNNLGGGMGIGFGGNVGVGLGMHGPTSPRRSPRASDRSPGGPNNGMYSPYHNSNKVNLNTGAGSGANPDEPLDMALLEDVPAWLRSLRLHKYTPNFEKSTWQDMIKLDDAALDQIGVSALGARRKLLKVFETVRIKTGNALPGDGAVSPSPTSQHDTQDD